MGLPFPSHWEGGHFPPFLPAHTFPARLPSPTMPTHSFLLPVLACHTYLPPAACTSIACPCTTVLLYFCLQHACASLCLPYSPAFSLPVPPFSCLSLPHACLYAIPALLPPPLTYLPTGCLACLVFCLPLTGALHNARFLVDWMNRQKTHTPRCTHAFCSCLPCLFPATRALKSVTAVGVFIRHLPHPHPLPPSLPTLPLSLFPSLPLLWLISLLHTVACNLWQPIGSFYLFFTSLSSLSSGSPISSLWIEWTGRDKTGTWCRLSYLLSPFPSFLLPIPLLPG